MRTACVAGTNTGVWRGSEPSGKRTIFSGVWAGLRLFDVPGWLCYANSAAAVTALLQTRCALSAPRYTPCRC